MNPAHPELVFVKGPQRGRRVALSQSLLIAGRGATVQIPLLEDTVSRQQMRFELTAQGCLVENLSKTSPMRIGGKKFKPGRRVLLATGDVLSVGVDTSLLFVDAGDDASEAVARYEAENPGPEPVPVAPPSPVAAPTTPPPLPDLSSQPADYLDVPQEEDAEVTKEELAEQERKAKLKKYAVGFGIYLVLMLVGVIVLMQMKGGKKEEEVGGIPERLTAEKIERALSSEMLREPNEVASQKFLAEARRLFEERTKDPANLYRCHKAYRLYMAYRRKDQRFYEEPDDSRNSSIVERELAERIAEIYDNAMLFEQGQRWVRASQELDLLWKYLPPEDMRDDPKVHEALWENVLAHQRYIRHYLNQER